MNPTKIEWVKNPDGSHGYTLTYAFGCGGDGCVVDGERNCCYARRIAKRFKNRCEDCYNFVPHFHFDRLNKLFVINKQVGVFNSMGDPFDKKLLDFQIKFLFNEYIYRLLQHRFYILTKQAQRLSDFSYSPNVWLGVTVNMKKDVWRIEELLKSNAVIKFVSFEPLYELVIPDSLNGIDWIIIGAESRNGRTTFMPDLVWVGSLIDLAKKYGCKVFLKNNLNVNGFSPILQEFPL